MDSIELENDGVHQFIEESNKPDRNFTADWSPPNTSNKLQ